MTYLSRLSWKILLVLPLLLLAFCILSPREAQAGHKVFGFTGFGKDRGADTHCAGHRSYVRWITKEYRNENTVGVTNITVEIWESGALVKTLGGNSVTGWYCVDLYNSTFKTIVSGGANWHDFWMHWYIKNPADWDYKEIDAHVHLVPRTWGATAVSAAPAKDTWINYDPRFKVRLRHMSGVHSTGTFNLIIQDAGPSGGVFQTRVNGGNKLYTVGPFGLGDGWHSWIYAFGMNGGWPMPLSSYPTDSPSSSNVVWEGFGIDRVRPVVISTWHRPPGNPFSTQPIDLKAKFRDQANLSGLRWIQIRYNVNGGAWRAPMTSPNYGGTHIETFTKNIGRWVAGTRICYEARSRDRAGNQSGWAGRKCFKVIRGADLVVDPIGNYGDFHVGITFSVDVVVRNTGKQNAGAFKLQFCPRGNPATYVCSVAWRTRNIGGLRAGRAVLRSFDVTAPNSVGFPRTYHMLARADWPPPGAVPEENESSNNRNRGRFTVIGPPPWFQTKVGDVGSYERIDPEYPPQKAGEKSADYLVISDGLIDKFTSFRNWLVPGYTGINVRPVPESGSIYQAFFNKYKPDTTNTIANLNDPKIQAAGGDRIFFVGGNGTLTVTGGVFTYDKDPAVVFVKNHMEINGDLKISSNTGIIFVVNKFVRIKKKVTQADGVYLFDEDYEVRSKDNSSEEPLVVNGSVLGASDNGNFLLERDFRSADSWEKPTELFIFEPKYLWLFRDTLGDVKTRFKEVAP